MNVIQWFLALGKLGVHLTRRQNTKQGQTTIAIARAIENCPKVKQHPDPHLRAVDAVFYMQ